MKNSLKDDFAIYKMNPIWDDPRFDGFETINREDFKLIQTTPSPRKSKDYSIKRLADTWKPIVTKRRVRKFNDFPTLDSVSLAFSKRAVDALRDFLEPNGEILPLISKSGEYFFYNLTTIIDALNTKESTIDWLTPGIYASEITKYSLNYDAVAHANIFRIPESSDFYVSKLFYDRVKSQGLAGFCFQKIWSLSEGSVSNITSELIIHKENTTNYETELANAMSQSLHVDFFVSRGKSTREMECQAIDEFMDDSEEFFISRASNDFAEGHVQGWVQFATFERVEYSCPDAARLKTLLMPLLKDLNWKKKIKVSVRHVPSEDEETKAHEVTLINSGIL